MKKFNKLSALLLILSLLLCSCGDDGHDDDTLDSNIGTNDDSFGEKLDESGIYDGLFEGEKNEVTVNCVSGTPNCYTNEGGIITFSSISEDSVYSISGELSGSIIIEVGDSYKFDLELHGLSIISTDTNPITVLSGDKVSITAKKDTKNYIYDKREAVTEDDETRFSAAIHSEVDLDICGKGEFSVLSENNKGIHTKDDLEVKNLTLTVACTDNALKGNDSVTLKSGTTTLIAASGNGIKTSNTDVSEKGNQRGTVAILGGEHTVYAACDGIDAAYNVTVEGEATKLNVYTDKYSNYSTTVTAVAEDVNYIRYTRDDYKYSVKYYNSDSDFLWVDAEYHSTVSGMRQSYYYYSFPTNEEYEKMQFFIYSSDMTTSSEESYLAASDYLSKNTGYDTLALMNTPDGISCSWTNYTTKIQEGGRGDKGGFGGGGRNEGNSDKSEYSTKGIKAGNEIAILGGEITVKAYDDAIHANADATLENGSTPTGNVTITQGKINLYSNDDGIHADGNLKISGGTVNISYSYEGIEGKEISISDGKISATTRDDGINSTATSGTGIKISGGEIYIYAGGDGIDSNSRTSYSGINFAGGKTVVICTSGGNSAIDSESGYTYTGGEVLAIGSSGGMSSETEDCPSFDEVATAKSLSLSNGSYLTVLTPESQGVVIKLNFSLSARVVYLGSSDADISVSDSSSAELDGNGVGWNS